MQHSSIHSPLLTRLNLACMQQVRSRRDVSFDPAIKRIARLEATVPLFLAMARKEITDAMTRQRAEREQQAARLKEEAQKDRQQLYVADYGPRAQRRRIVLEDRVDIGSDAEFKPTIRAARRADPLRVILKIKSVHRPHDGTNADDARRWIAAQTYRNLLEIAGGARVGERSMEWVDRSRGASATGPNDMILDCIGIVTKCQTAMGAACPVVQWIVVEYSDLDELAAVSRRTVAEAEKALLAGLDALAEQLESYHGPASA